MGAPMVKTKTPGIFQRGSRYVVVYRVNGRQRKETVRTYDEARRLKRAREAARDAGEFQELSRVKFAVYAREWIERYHGTGSRGFREETRDEYRRDLERYAVPYFDERLGRTVAQISPRDVAAWIGWLCEQPARQGATLSDRTVRRILAAFRSCMATAVREGVIRYNPCAGAALPHRQVVDDGDEEDVRVMSREQLATFLAVVHPRHRLFFRLLAATGLRWSEAIALQWRHLELDGAPAVRVRRRMRRGKIGPPKSKYGRRDVPLEPALATDLRRARAEAERTGDEDLVFTSLQGGPLDHADLTRRVLKPAAEEAGAGWAGMHTFRHTCASLLFARGASPVQVQRWLGHHSPSFTLDTYVHLLPGDAPEPLRLSEELRPDTPDTQEARAGATPGATDPRADGLTGPDALAGISDVSGLLRTTPEG